MTVYTALPTDDLNLAVEVTESNDMVTININPAAVNVTGAVTSVNTLTGDVVLTTSNTGFIKADSTDTLTNKSGSNLQWTNDAGYITSETDSQTLSFTTPTMTISGGNAVDISSLITGFIKADTTDTLTNKSGSNSQWTNDAGYTTNTGTVTPDSTDTFTNKSGAISQWTNDSAYLTSSALSPYYTSTQVDSLPVSTFTNDVGYSTTTGTVTPTSTDTFTNKSGAISQWTNDAGYSTTTGTVTPASTDTFTNKSGAISQWTNDSGYITSETDSQTLSFANPDLTISSGNTVDLSALNTTTLAWSAITSTPTTTGGYGITDAATQTTIANNALNSVITGSASADLLNGNSDFTWNGSQGLMSGTTSGLTAPILKLESSTSSWNAPQLMCSDSNGDVFSQVGRLNTGGSVYQWNITLDPNNTHGRTGVSSWAGDYFVAFEKNYSDQADIEMNMNVFGAHKGFNINVRDDYNSGGGNQYKGRPLNLNALETNINTGLNRDVLTLTVKEDVINCEVPIGQAQLSSDPASPANGWTYYNTTTDKLRLYAAGAWVDLN